MNRHDLSDKHMRKQRLARQEGKNLSTKMLDEEVEDIEENEEIQYSHRRDKRKNHPIKPYLPDDWE